MTYGDFKCYDDEIWLSYILPTSELVFAVQHL